ncbi:MAG: MATE family efflux transporter [Bacteroidaceae bacterium]|nr:MATE family efflux transporter [Bacteroidaceae bacterium]
MNLRNRQILSIALPSIVSNITVPLLGLIDVAITGHIGTAAYIGAIAVGGMLFNVIYWMFAFLRMGTSGMTAQARGRRDFAGITRLLARSLGIALGISLVLMALSPIVRELALQVIAPSADVGLLARRYFNICIWGAPASLGLFALNGWFIGMQNSRTPMLVAISQNLVNIVASLALVFGLGMKIEGIALGTVVAQWSGFLAALALLHKYYRKLWKKGWPPDIWERPAILRFFNVNKDIFLRTLCLIFVHFFFIAAGARQGDTELAVNTLLMQFFTLYSYFMDGFAFAGEALAGKAIGAQNRQVYHSVVKHLFGWGVAMALLFTLLYFVAGPWFLHLLTDDASVIQTAAAYQPWTLLFPLCGMAAFIWDGIYIGATATRYMLLSMAVGMGVFFALYVLLISTLANHGLWIAFLCYLTMRGVVQTLTRKQIYGKQQKKA